MQPMPTDSCTRRSSNLPVFPPMQAGDFEEIIFVQNRHAGLKAIICIHSTHLGPAHGGIRRLAYQSEAGALADVMRLAWAMSRKTAMAGIPAGGGKAVIIDHPGLRRHAGYEALGCAIDKLGGRFYTGPDVGTTEADLAAVRRHTSFVVEAQTGSGPGDIAEATARGVIASIRATLQFLYSNHSPAGHRFAIQGLGAIGARVGEWLWSSGAELSVAEIDTAKLRRWRGRPRVRVVPPDRILATACDILSPCALGGVISTRTTLNCRAVVGAANNPLADDTAALALHKRGILFAPDFVVNAGGVIEGAGRHLGFADKTAEAIERIGDTLLTIYRRARRAKQPPYAVALTMADKRLRSGRGPAGRS